MNKNLKIKLFADGADKNDMLAQKKNPLVKGFTTNPSLMRKAGVTEYKAFCHEILKAIPDLPISFEVFSDEFPEMERQALEIASWGKNVYVKIPIMNSKKQSAIPLIKKLVKAGVMLNVTAIMPIEQVKEVAPVLAGGPPSIISVFAGRIADTGRDPMPIMRESAAIIAKCQNVELLWASSRELLNVFQAEESGCHIITVTNDIIKKMSSSVGKDLHDFSHDTVKMFLDDATKAGYKL